MNVPLEYAIGTILFSVGRFTTAESIDQAADAGVRAAAGRQGAAARYTGTGPIIRLSWKKTGNWNGVTPAR
ncbi:MAG: hypothetical protein LLF99_09650 [Desulfobacteraceae bacterium]|nr:hypothetical protein [Desulfobacteraceae bacterium]